MVEVLYVEVRRVTDHETVQLHTFITSSHHKSYATTKLEQQLLLIARPTHYSLQYLNDNIPTIKNIASLQIH